MKDFKPKSKTINVLESITCDICGDKTGFNGWSPGYEENEVIIKHTKGVQYPGEGLNGEELELDICPKCFESKVIPALKALGVKLVYKEIPEGEW